jgi:hypothetical protein
MFWSGLVPKGVRVVQTMLSEVSLIIDDNWIGFNILRRLYRFLYRWPVSMEGRRKKGVGD